MVMLATRWAVLGDFGVMLRHVGGEMATKSVRMNQHRRQGTNPRGFQGSAGAQEVSGRERHPGVRPLPRVLARGGVAQTALLYSLTRGLKLEGLRI